jgi:hypothetical protein
MSVSIVIVVVLVLHAAAGCLGYCCLEKKTHRDNQKILRPRQARLVFGEWHDDNGVKRVLRETHSLAAGDAYYKILGGQLELSNGERIDLGKAGQHNGDLLKGKIFSAAAQRIRFLGGHPSSVGGPDIIPDGTEVYLRFVS